MTDAELAAQLASEAGRALVQFRADFGPVADSRRRELMDSGDRIAQELLSERLTQFRPDDAVLSEEAPDSPLRLSADRVWIIDPLDGTKEFGEGRPDFAVHVALWARDSDQRRELHPAGTVTKGVILAAAVDVPERGEIWRTDQPTIPTLLPTDRPLRMVVSRSRPPSGLDQLLSQVSADLADRGVTLHGIVPTGVGSVGAKLGEVMAGRAEAYIHPGGLNEWDLAAPHACALAFGLVALGPPQLFNRMPPTSGPVLICHPEIAESFDVFWRP